MQGGSGKWWMRRSSTRPGTRELVATTPRRRSGSWRPPRTPWPGRQCPPPCARQQQELQMGW
eukprot:593766-Pyramimonas_sp.AAC.1